MEEIMSKSDIVFLLYAGVAGLLLCIGLAHKLWTDAREKRCAPRLDFPKKQTHSHKNDLVPTR
jgi:hypothetical protein